MYNIQVKFSYKDEFCSHDKAVTIDYDIGIEHCPFCGALGHYNGDIDKIEKIVEGCKEGPPGAVVRNVETVWEQATGDYDSFTIKY